jgi:hypothetical protein
MAIWLHWLVLDAHQSLKQQMHAFEAPKGLSMWGNGRVCGGLLCNMETLKFCRPRAWTPKQRCQRATTSSLSIRIGVSSGVEPSLCTPKVCRHNHPLGSFPLFPYRCRYWELTSLSTGAKSKFWTLRYAFNCWNLSSLLISKAWLTWMFGNLKEAKSAKKLSCEFSNRVHWYYELFRMEVGANLMN